MASILHLEGKLERFDPSTPWGFRLQGGKDFGSPLIISKVTNGSLADKCGLHIGDMLIKIGDISTETLRHQEAQDTIKSSGNHLDLLLQRNKGHVFQPGGGGFPKYNASDVPRQNLSQPLPPPLPHHPPPPISQQKQPNLFSQSKPDYYSAPKPFASGPGATQPVGTSGMKSPGAAGDNADTINGMKNLNLSQLNADSYRKFVALDDRAARAAGFKTPTEMAQQHSDHDAAPLPASSPQQSAKKFEPPKAPPPPKAGHTTPQSSAPAAKPWQPSPRPNWAPSKPTHGGIQYGKQGDALMKDAVAGDGRIPVCVTCGIAIRGPFVVAMGKTWCPDHFICANPGCGTKLLDIGFVEEGGSLYCEKDYEKYFAPHCAKCQRAIIGTCVNALQKTWHPECFTCTQCHQPISGGSFHLEDGKPYCDADWAVMFQTMCTQCEFPIEPGDRWVEALGKNWHAECFNCSMCQVNLESQPFFPKGGKPYCKKHCR